jgi:MYXO-CTERM domain-containing protein
MKRPVLLPAQLLPAQLLPALVLAAATLCAGASWGAPTVHIIVDDQDGAPGFTLTGDDWTTWSTLGLGYASSDTSFHYLSSTVGGSDRRGTATWTPELPCAGTYQVSTWFRMTGNRTHDADHFVYDGNGVSTHFIIDQYGDGASGWIDLGTHYCGVGLGGCTVVLDGTDDDESDEANAMRFSLVECEGDPDDNVPACPDHSEPGVHTVTRHAGTAWTSGGWSDPQLAEGAADGQTASSPNLDSGEDLYGNNWGFCNPPGEETILKVQVGSLGQTQYDSGNYDVLVKLSAGGTSSTSWHHTDLLWDDVDVTADSSAWGWFAINLMSAQVGLDSHPGGANDADVWVDALRVEVTYESHEPSLGGGGSSPQGGAGGEATGGAGGSPQGGAGGTTSAGGAGASDPEGSCGCRSPGASDSSLRWHGLGLLALAGLAWRRRRLVAGELLVPEQ